jgi:hypothetical protein
MREAVLDFGKLFGLGGGVHDGSRLTRRLQLSFGLLTAALCVAFMTAGCGPLPIACAVLTVGAIAFGPGLMRRASGRLNFSMGATVASALCVSLLIGATVGCTPAQQATAKSVAARIGGEIPKVLPLVAVLSSVASGLLPAEAPLVASVSGTVQASLVQLAALCNTYASAPSAGVWDSIVATVNTLVNSGSGALLDAAHIADPHSRELAQAALGALQTLLLVIDGFVQTAQTKAQNKATAQARVVKLRQIEQYLNHREVEEATGYRFNRVMSYETALGF